MWVQLFLTLALTVAAPEPFPLGKIVDSVACRERPKQKYALFLPSNYHPDREWPIVIMLDPAARGKAPLERFAPAAEDLGYVLIGSHNSRNGPLEPTVEALSALWADALERFAIDPARVYLAGFSGGARMASRLAKHAAVAGVIACGAGLLSGDAERFPYAYAAVAGRRDMNYLEVRVLAENLRQAGARATFLEFDGGHEWPPPDIARRALEWLKLVAMRRGLEPRSDELFQHYSQEATARARALEEEDHRFEALTAYRMLVYDLEDLYDVSEAKGRAALLEEHRQVREERRRQARTDEIEQREIRTLLKQFLSDRPSKKADWWNRKLDFYRKLADRDLRNSEDLSRRLLQFVLSYAAEHAWFAAQAEEYQRALYLTRVALLAKPESGELHYRLARLLALTGETQAALTALQQAFESGWQDLARLQGDEAFDGVRNRPQFQQQLETLTRKQPAPPR